MTAPLPALVERLEKAEGPDRELDFAIWKVTRPATWEWFGSKVVSVFQSSPGQWGCNTEDGYRHLDCATVPYFTNCIDTAIRIFPFRTHRPIALCIAALRARTGGGEHG